jgi:uncharacterized integral membrane protein
MLRILIAAPFLILMVLFALSNPPPVALGLWPTDFTIQVPLSLAILAAMGIGFFFGALLLWVSAVGARARARRAERHVRQLEAQVQELKARVIRPQAPSNSYAVAAPASVAGASRSLAPVP